MYDCLAWALGGLLIILTVSAHYETMLLVSDHVVPWAINKFHSRRVIAIAIGALFLGHIAEIWVWALAYKGMLTIPHFGQVSGDFDGSFNSYLYFSAVTYTSLGDNALRAVGALRSVVACEPMAGLMMTAWSASFTYLKMERIWRDHKK